MLPEALVELRHVHGQVVEGEHLLKEDLAVEGRQHAREDVGGQDDVGAGAQGGVEEEGKQEAGHEDVPPVLGPPEHGQREGEGGGEGGGEEEEAGDAPGVHHNLPHAAAPRVAVQAGGGVGVGPVDRNAARCRRGLAVA